MVYERVVKAQESVVPGLRHNRGGNLVARGMRRIALLPAWRLFHLYRAQSHLIFPGQITQGREDTIAHATADSELLRLKTAGGDEIAALFGPALLSDGSPHPRAASRPTILFFYGNTMCLHRSEVIFSHLRRMGLNVMVPEFIGYGMSTGTVSEANCYATADAAFNHLLSRPDVDRKKIMVGGASLGGAVAVDLASRHPEVVALLTLVTFTSIPLMARHLQPRVPIWRFIKHKFDSLSKMPRVTCPTLIGHSLDDTLVPVSMAAQLESAAGGPVERVNIEGVDHGSMQMIEAGASILYTALRAFVDQYIPERDERLVEAA